MMDKTEKKVADAILQNSDDIKIGEKTYQAAPPSVATLILVSEAVSRLPHIKLNEDNITEEVLYIAKDCRVLGEITAILILGARNIKEEVIIKETASKSRFFGLLKKNIIVENKKEVNRCLELTNELINTLSPRELNNLLVRLLQRMQIEDFFGLTTFLTEINLLRPTKVVEETTAFGQ